MDEVKFEFGNVSNPVKIGDTVHRDSGVWTPSVHKLLNYLEEHGFDAAPRALGFDSEGREILTYLPGEAVFRPWQEVLLSGDGLEQLAKLLRKYHDLVAGFDPGDDAQWRVGKLPLKKGQIIRHGDLGAWNTLWQDGILTGIIDWDFAQPGERIEDLAQMAYHTIPLRGEQIWKNAGFSTRPDFLNRLESLVAAYGMFTVDEVLAAALRVIENDSIIVKEKGAAGIHPWAKFLKRGDVENINEDIQWILKLKKDLKM